jgi:hypothetical protein
MRSLIIIICGFTFFSNAFGQTESRLFYDFKIGDSINVYKELIQCAEHGTASNFASNSECRAYRYLPAEKDSVRISSIYFGTVFLFPNDQHKIKTIAFSQNIIGKDSLQARNEIENEYKILVGYFDRFYDLTGIKMDIDSSEYYTGEQTVWKLTNETITLRKFVSKQRILSKNKKVFVNSIDLSIY